MVKRIVQEYFFARYSSKNLGTFWIMYNKLRKLKIA